MGKSSTDTTFKEKWTGLLYVLLLFISVSFLCSYILFFSDSDYHFVKSKKDALVQLERVSSFQKVQSAYMDQVKKLNDDVNSINPGMIASYEKRELFLSLGELQKFYSDNKYDDRYRIFDQIAHFYEIKLFDRERLYSIKKNIERFYGDLERCRNDLSALNP